MADIPMFVPVYGQLDEILSSTGRAGHVYFATDARKIFYYDNEEFKLMGNNSGVWYGTLDYEARYETPDPDQRDFIFELIDIEGNEDRNSDNYLIPYVNDLIFNTPDSSFYRVMSIIDDIEEEIPKLQCYKLAVAGSGGGISSGGGGSGTATGVEKIVFSRNGKANMTVINGQECLLECSLIAQDVSGQSLGNARGRVVVNGRDITNNFVIQQNKINQFDVGPYLDASRTNDVQIYMRIKNSAGSEITQYKTWSIDVVEFVLTWNPSTTRLTNTTTNYTFAWGITTKSEHRLLISVDKKSPIIVSKKNSLNYTYSIGVEQLGFSHGSYQVDLQAEIDIDGKTYTSNKITKTFMYIDSNSSIPIISIDCYQNSMQQYDNLTLPITIYDPNLTNEDLITAQLFEDDIFVTKWEIQNNQQYIVNYYPETPGSKVLRVTTGTKEQLFVIQVNKIAASDLIEPSDVELKLNVKNILNKETLKNWETVINGNRVYLEFSEHFNWDIGGLRSEEIVRPDGTVYYKKCIHIKNGDSMKIKNYYPLTGIGNNGFCFKVIFRVTNSTNHNASFLVCGEKNSSNSLIDLQTEQAIYGFGGKLEVPYCENECIELEFDISKNVTGKKYVTAWIDGTPAYVTTYTNTTGFNQTSSNKQELIFAPQNCDIDVYLVKVYKKHLTDEEHLINFILDGNSSLEVGERYYRNNILNDNGTISLSKLAETNPNCEVYHFNVQKLPTGKGNSDYVENRTVEGGENYNFYYYSQSSTPKYYSNSYDMRCQGTSAMSYGVSAFNLDVRFNQLANYDTNEEITSWQMTPNSIGTKYFNYKVNVASAEGANNALNQEWYNRYVPYQTLYQRKRPNSRNAMEFYKPGVIFLTDRNPDKYSSGKIIESVNAFQEYDNGNYVSSPTPRMYAICNMGNSKYNTEVFCDGYNLEKAQSAAAEGISYTYNSNDITIEVNDNSTALHAMRTVIPYNESATNLDDLFDSDSLYYVQVKDNRPVIGLKQGEKITYVSVVNGEHYDSTNSYYLSSGFASSNDIYTPLNDLSNYFDQGTTEDQWIFTNVHENVIYKEVKSSGGGKQKIYECRWEQHENNYLNVCKAWLRLVNWFAQYNPADATGNLLPESETFSTYTFRGYQYIDWETGQEYQITGTDYRPQILKNFELGDYAGTYTHDTKEYRIAKLLSTCEDYLIMDAVVFHYLFIERHCLVDNVAKNTFWHTEDGLHWAPIKDYDNDTADGIDNNGFLKFHYGYEPLDNVDYDINKGRVFNATGSAWLNFIDGLYSARQQVYQALCNTYAYINGTFVKDITLNNERLSVDNAWAAEPYIKTFNAWQNAIPERVWIEDCYRKYKRPYEIYNNKGYLGRLAGGKKTYQRENFELLQEYYMESEYFGLTYRQSPIDMRIGAKQNNGILDIKPYCNCYVNLAIGSGNEVNHRARVLTTEEYTRFDGINTSSSTDNDITCYVYGPKYIIGLDKLENHQMKIINAGSAIKLKEIIISDTVSNSNLNTLSIDSPTLEKLILKNITNSELLSNELNLIKCVNLRDLDLTGSNFSAVYLPSFAPITNLNLAEHQTLFIKDLYRVETFNISPTTSNNQGIYLNSIDNSNANNLSSKLLVQNNINKIDKYSLMNVEWHLTDGDITKSGNIVTIPLLEQLYSKDQFVFTTTKTGDNETVSYVTELINNGLGISGTIYLPAGLQENQCMSVYSKYNLTSGAYNYPNISFIFDNVSLYSVKIFDGNDNLKWQRQGVNIILNNDFLANSPTGVFDDTDVKIKTSTPQYDYEFINWVIKTENGTILAEVDNITEYTATINQNIEIYPQFNNIIRKYTASFIVPFYAKSGLGFTVPTGTAPQTNFDITVEADYDTNIYELFAKNSSYIPYKTLENPNGSNLYKTFIFTGWSEYEDNNALPLNITLRKDTLYYPCFEFGSVFDPRNVHKLYGDWFTYSYDSNLGPCLMPQKVLGGKIVLPANILIAPKQVTFRNNASLDQPFNSTLKYYRKINGTNYTYISINSEETYNTTKQSYDLYTIEYDQTASISNTLTSTMFGNKYGSNWQMVTHLFFEQEDENDDTTQQCQILSLGSSFHNYYNPFQIEYVDFKHSNLYAMGSLSQYTYPNEFYPLTPPTVEGVTYPNFYSGMFLYNPSKYWNLYNPEIENTEVFELKGPKDNVPLYYGVLSLPSKSSFLNYYFAGNVRLLKYGSSCFTITGQKRGVTITFGGPGDPSKECTENIVNRGSWGARVPDNHHLFDINPNNVQISNITCYVERTNDFDSTEVFNNIFNPYWNYTEEQLPADFTPPTWSLLNA